MPAEHYDWRRQGKYDEGPSSWRSPSVEKCICMQRTFTTSILITTTTICLISPEISDNTQSQCSAYGVLPATHRALLPASPPKLSARSLRYSARPPLSSQHGLPYPDSQLLSMSQHGDRKAELVSVIERISRMRLTRWQSAMSLSQSSRVRSLWRRT
jgi:hypothetical protein